MEKQSYSFRSSLHGFHRGDVISFLEKLSASHERELRDRDEQLRIAREELAEARAALESARTERAPEPAEPAEPAPGGFMRSRELEAYRRAERHEREAKVRAEKLCADASEAVRQAGRQLEDRQVQMYSATDALSADFAALQSAVSEILGEMNDTRGRLTQMERDLAAAD